jgi:O-antigen/teichoic acid export membrane protein
VVKFAYFLLWGIVLILRYFTSRAEKQKNGIIVLFLKGLEAIVGAAMAIMMARLMGPVQFGVFSFGIASIALISIPIKSGSSNVITKQVAIGLKHNDFEFSGGLLLSGFRLMAIYSGVVILILWIFAWCMIDHRLFIVSAAWVSFALPFLCVTGLTEGILRGSFRPNIAIFLGSLLTPLLVIFAVLFSSPFIGIDDWRIASKIYIASSSIACFWGLLIVRGFLRNILSNAVEVSNRDFLTHVAPFALVTGLLVFNRQIDVIILGVVAGEVEAGIYRIAAQAAILVTFGVQAIGHLYAPYLAAASGSGKSESVSLYLRKSVVFSLGLGGSALVCLTLWAGG